SRLTTRRCLVSPTGSTYGPADCGSIQVAQPGESAGRSHKPNGSSSSAPKKKTVKPQTFESEEGAATLQGEENASKLPLYHPGCCYYARTPGCRRPLWSPAPPLEPEDASFHLHRPQRHLHHRPAADPDLHRRGLRVRQGDRRPRRQHPVR